MFGQKFFPYSTLQELNLDWILTKVKNILRFVPDDGAVGQILRRTRDGAEWSNETGGGGAVDSVNGQTGTVVLTASDVGALPDSYTPPVTSVNTKTGAVVLDKTDIGLGNVANVAQYSASNPPPYPVTSVNGQTGVVVLDASDVGALPDTTTIPTKTSDLNNDSGFITSAQAPVQSVNGQTGNVNLYDTDDGTIAYTRSGGTLQQWSCHRVGNIVNAGARVYSISETASGVFFKIPEGFRPTSTRAGLAWVYIGSVTYCVNCEIRANGDVYVFFSTSQTLNQIGFVVTYPI